MISQRKRAANKQNAEQATGPRTSDGKKRSAQNARRYGFTGALAREDIEREAALFLSDIEAPSPQQQASAWEAAEAQLRLREVMQTEEQLMERAGVLAGLGRAVGGETCLSASGSKRRPVSWPGGEASLAGPIDGAPNGAESPPSLAESERHFDALRRLNRYARHFRARRRKALKAIYEEER